MGRSRPEELPPCADHIDAQSRRPAGLCVRELAIQNAHFQGTAGLSGNNRGAGFVPAYLNTDTGEAVPSCFGDGRLAAVHVLEGLPDGWVAARDEHGCVTRAVIGVIAGFLRDGRFFTREAAAQVLAQSKAGVVKD